ncbi:conserved hypothetical protein [Hyphomicrobiales bacterium]|nr:hypothetical protein CHELA1G2_10448 [Hyphomicrobiales bacterium]CAH1674593.1 conserved hypothetical protein [Hyphomicrobiales bacterium]
MLGWPRRRPFWRRLLLLRVRRRARGACWLTRTAWPRRLAGRLTGRTPLQVRPGDGLPRHDLSRHTGGRRLAGGNLGTDGTGGRALSGPGRDWATAGRYIGAFGHRSRHLGALALGSRCLGPWCLGPWRFRPGPFRTLHRWLLHLRPLLHLLPFRSPTLRPARPSARRPLVAFGALAALRSPPLRAAILSAVVGRTLREPQPRLVRRPVWQVVLRRGSEGGVEWRSRHAGNRHHDHRAGEQSETGHPHQSGPLSFAPPPSTEPLKSNGRSQLVIMTIISSRKFMMHMNVYS